MVFRAASGREARCSSLARMYPLTASVEAMRSSSNPILKFEFSSICPPSQRLMVPLAARSAERSVKSCVARRMPPRETFQVMPRSFRRADVVW